MKRFSSNNDEDIRSKLNDEVFTKIKELKHIPTNYKLVITGTVGSGKSTICESLCYLFSTINVNINTFPEFISMNEFGNEMLKQRIDKKFSAVTFQNYILDNWENILKDKVNQGFNMFERCVDDSVLCFCNIFNYEHDMSDMELYSTFNRMQNINQKYNMPTYYSNETNSVHFTEICSGNLNYNLMQIIDIISNDVKNNITSRIIGLSVSDFDSIYRIKKRNRDSETNYNIDEIKLYNAHYHKLFKYLSKGKKLTRFIDIGRLL